jgi:hypothetical protein
MMAGAGGRDAVLSRTLWSRPIYALRTDREKFVYHSGTGEEKLFDLTSDPQEMTDRLAKEPLRAAYYRETLRVALAKQSSRESSKPIGGPMPCDVCLNMKSLGYIPASHPCNCPDDK